MVASGQNFTAFEVTTELMPICLWSDFYRWPKRGGISSQNYRITSSCPPCKLIVDTFEKKSRKTILCRWESICSHGDMYQNEKNERLGVAQFILWLLRSFSNFLFMLLLNKCSKCRCETRNCQPKLSSREFSTIFIIYQSASRTHFTELPVIFYKIQ